MMRERELPNITFCFWVRGGTKVREEGAEQREERGGLMREKR